VRLYLTWSSIPELAALPKAEGLRAWRHAFPRALFHPVSLLVLVAGSFAMSQFSALLVSLTQSHWLAAAIGMPCAGVLGLLYGSFITYRARPLIAAFLRREQEHPRSAG
jgi:hypothetical protein